MPAKKTEAYDDFSDLYDVGAPTGSIAAGDDYGRLHGLAHTDANVPCCVVANIGANMVLNLISSINI